MNIKSDRLSLHIYFRDIGVQQCGYIYLGFKFIPFFCNHERYGIQVQFCMFGIRMIGWDT